MEQLVILKIGEKLWRVMNIAIFLLALIGPWGTVFGDTVYGFDMLRLPLLFVSEWLLGEDVPGFWLSWGLYYSFGWLWLGIYSFVNVIRIIKQNKFWLSLWLNIPLVISAGFLLLDTSSRILFDNYNRFWWFSLYWGYWLLLFSIGSSLLLEVISYLLGRIRGGISKDENPLISPSFSANE